MIAISSVEFIDLGQYDEVWYITNTNIDMRPGAQHHKELAPFIGHFMSHKRGDMTKSQLLNEYGNSLWSGKYSEAINNLITESEKGKWIQLVCYCKDENCHRNVLAKYLKTVYGKVVVLDE